MLKIYGISNCDTVQKAIKCLKHQKVDFIYHDFRKDGLSDVKIEEWLTQVPLDKLINKKSSTYKALDENEKEALTNTLSAVEVLKSKPTVIKRPVLEDYKIVAVGFDLKIYENLH